MIFMCKVGAYNSLYGSNLLYLNQGLNENGIPFFIEDVKSYNLGIESFATQSSFFDFDLDGDLDCFLLNHYVNPNSNYGNGNKRNEFNALSGDKLSRNDDGKSVDIINDGKMDSMSLNMLPENLLTYKTSGLEFSYQPYEYYFIVSIK